MGNMNNYQAVGYMLLACKHSGIPLEEVKKIYDSIYYIFDIKTEEEAEKQGFNWYYKMKEMEEKNIGNVVIHSLRISQRI